MRDVIPVWPIVLGNKVGAREQPLPRCLEPAKPWGKVIRLDDSHFSLEARRLPITFIGIHIFHTPEFSLGLASCLAAAYDKKLSTVNHHQTLTNPRLRQFEGYGIGHTSGVQRPLWPSWLLPWPPSSPQSSQPFSQSELCWATRGLGRVVFWGPTCHQQRIEYRLRCFFSHIFQLDDFDPSYNDRYLHVCGTSAWCLRHRCKQPRTCV